MKPAPIIVFAYNRPWHLEQTLIALSANQFAAESDLHIFVDGPKANASPTDLQKWDHVKNIAQNAKGFSSISVRVSPSNKGLAKSIISGITEIISRSGKAIIVEDDVITSPFFLRFMNEALDKYETDPRVLSVGSWNYFTEPANTSGNFFLHMPDTIAWATWKRAWDLFVEDAEVLLGDLRKRNLMKKFNLGNRYDFERMLVMQSKGEVDSWAIRWTAVAVLNNTLTLYPHFPLSKHIGFGADSTNCEGEDYNRNILLADSPVPLTTVEFVADRKAEDAWFRIEKEIKHSGAVMDQGRNIMTSLKSTVKKIIGRK